MKFNELKDGKSYEVQLWCPMGFVYLVDMLSGERADLNVYTKMMGLGENIASSYPAKITSLGLNPHLDGLLIKIHGKVKDYCTFAFIPSDELNSEFSTLYRPETGEVIAKVAFDKEMFKSSILSHINGMLSQLGMSMYDLQQTYKNVLDNKPLRPQNNNAN